MLRTPLEICQILVPRYRRRSPLSQCSRVQPTSRVGVHRRVVCYGTMTSARNKTTGGSESAAEDEEAYGSDWRPERVHELIENLEELKKQNSSLKHRVRYLEAKNADIISKPKGRSSDSEDGSKKLSKWSKMKGALGWEMKSETSAQQEEMDLLKVPAPSSSDHSSSVSASPQGSSFVSGESLNEGPTHGSTSSSEEDLLANELSERTPEGDHEFCTSSEIEDKEHKSSDCTSPLLDLHTINKKIIKSSQKEYKTPWSKMKGIIHNTRVVGVKKRHSQDETDTVCEEKHIENSTAHFSNMENDDVIRPMDNCRLSLPMLTVTVPSLEELSPKPSSSNMLFNSSQQTIEDNGQQLNDNQVKEHVPDISPPIPRKSSKWFKVKNVFLPSGHTIRTSSSAPCSPVRSDSFIYEVESDEISSGEFIDEAHKELRRYTAFNDGRDRSLREEIQEDYHRLQRRLGEEFRMKAKDWERRRRCGLQSSGNSSVGEDGRQEGNGGSCQDNLSADFKKKLEEWDRMKWNGDGKGSCSRDSLHWDPKVNPFEVDTSALWTRHQQRAPRRKSEGSKGAGERRLFLSERWRKCNRSGETPTERKSVKRGAKELAWLEKELQKIEREKQRLDREKEKFLQREARLKKMRLAVGSSMRKQEVLIPTSTGMFRFQGISQKFTRKLFEWEVAQGIRPEASTFALLDPGYKLSLNSNSHGAGESGSVLVRSKSVGSVADLGVSSANPEGITHQPSSLSLNDMDGLEVGDEVPEAIIVDLEDVSEDTSLVANSQIIKQTPVYCYAPEEVTRLIDSSGSESEDVKKNLACKQAVESSYQLLQENMCLLNKLKEERDVCLKLEHDMEHLEGQINDVSKSFENELERLDVGIHNGQSKTKHMIEIRTRIDELDLKKEELQFKEDTLKERFVEHSVQEAELAQNLVGNMRELQKTHYNIASLDRNRGYDFRKTKENLLSVLQDLSSQLLLLAERLELNLNARNQEVWKIRQAVRDHRRTMSDEIMKAHYWTMSSYNFPKQMDYFFERQWMDEVFQIPMLLTNKILELRKVLDCLCNTTVSECCPLRKHDAGLMDEDSEGSLVDAYRTMDSGKDLHSNSEHGHMQDEIREDECSSPASSFTFQPVTFRQESGLHQRKSSVWEWEKLNSDNMIAEESQQNYDDDDNSTTVSRDEEKPLSPNFSDYDYYANLEQLKRNSVYGDIINEDSSHDEDVSEVEPECHPPPLPPVPEDFGYYPSKRMRLGSYEEKTDEESSSGDCRSPDDCYKNPTVNVFVQTTRKIFSPVYIDESGETASVVEIVVKGDVEPVEETKEEGYRPICKWEARPGWNLRDRAQSASPAVFRKRRKSSLSSLPRSSPQSGRRHLSCIKLNPTYKIKPEVPDGVSDSATSSDSFTAIPETKLIAESVDYKNTVDVGFPPISPVHDRRGIKQTNRESPTSLRMIMEKYNRKLKEEENSEGGSTSCVVGWRSPQSKVDQRSDYRQEIRGILGGRTASTGVIRGADPIKSIQNEGIIKSSSVGAIGPSSLRQASAANGTFNDSGTSVGGEGTAWETTRSSVGLLSLEEDGMPTPESRRLRAMKLKQAKEEFLQRGLEKNLSPWQEDVEPPESASIVVSQERLNELGSRVLFVKSADDDPMEIPEEVEQEEKDPSPSPTLGYWGRLKWRKKIKKRGPKNGSMRTVSVLCRQSLVVDIDSEQRLDSESQNNSVKSCPSSPVLLRPSTGGDSTSSSSTSWIRNPAKFLFRPKGKYTIKHA